MKRHTLDELHELAEAARMRTHLDALDAVRGRLRADTMLERALEAGTLEPYAPELLERAQVVELDPVTVRSLVEAARALVEHGPRDGEHALDIRLDELLLAADVARARFAEVTS